jgi:hypothetical protein
MVCDAQQRLDDLLATAVDDSEGHHTSSAEHALRRSMATMLREAPWPWNYPPLYEPY